MKHLKFVLPAILISLSFSVNASLVDDTIYMQHYFNGSAVPGTGSQTVVTNDSSDSLCSYAGCDYYTADFGANTISIEKLYSGWGSYDTSGFGPWGLDGGYIFDNGALFTGLDDSSGNAIAGVTVDTNIVDWDDSMLTFYSHSIYGNSIFVNFLNPIIDPLRGINIGNGYINLTLDYGPSIVPVPAAAWLFGSALLGFFGFSRRKANA